MQIFIKVVISLSVHPQLLQFTNISSLWKPQLIYMISQIFILAHHKKLLI
jgi:hypothetical protein